jgi:death on curing protein
MISLQTATFAHNKLIDKHGGSKGIRDLGGLEAALARPYATFDQQELYPTAIDKASAVFESLIINHPFLDGNKRIAYVLMRLVLLELGFDIIASQMEKYEMTISASTGIYRFDEIKQWLSVRIINNNQ